MEKRSKKPHRKFDLQFKSEAVKQVKTGRSVPSVAKALGISETLLYNWCKKEDLAHLCHGSNELDSLRKQLKQTETERDILKKALAIFSRVN